MKRALAEPGALRADAALVRLYHALADCELELVVRRVFDLSTPSETTTISRASCAPRLRASRQKSALNADGPRAVAAAPSIIADFLAIPYTVAALPVLGSGAIS